MTRISPEDKCPTCGARWQSCYGRYIAGEVQELLARCAECGDNWQPQMGEVARASLEWERTRGEEVG